MKRIINSIVILFLVSLSSCEGYFDVIPSETLTLDKVFSNRVTALEWLSHTYQYLPDESNQNYTGGADQTRGIWTPASLEADLPWSHCNSNLINNGSLNPSSGYVRNMWSAYYKGIQKANIYMHRIDACADMDEDTRLKTKAEARALRSIYYFNLFKIYGPFVIVGNRIFDNEAPVDSMMIPRSSVDECVSYMVGEFDALLEQGHLKSRFDSEGLLNNTTQGNITREAVEAIRSQVLLYAASYLFNGDPYYANMEDATGKKCGARSHNAGITP